MDIRENTIEGLLEIVPTVYKDDRGYFLETYHTERFRSLGIDQNFVQVNQSFSKRGVLRGLHFQHAPHQQGKLISVIKGKVMDVAVDLRPGSPTYGQHVTMMVDSERHNLVYVPEGFAHGFVAIEDTIFSYQCTNLYHQAADSGVRWNDPDLNIDWKLDHYGIQNPIISEKDQLLPSFAEYSQRSQTFEDSANT